MGAGGLAGNAGALFPAAGAGWDGPLKKTALKLEASGKLLATFNER
jgi:hypothetical protein